MKDVIYGLNVIAIVVTIAIAFDMSTSKDAAILLLISVGIYIFNLIYIWKN